MRVVLADDSLLIRQGVEQLLVEAGFEVVGAAGDAQELLRKVSIHGPDVAIVDVRMPPTHTHEGIPAALEIRERFPATRGLVLSQYAAEAYAAELLADTAEGGGHLRE